MLHLILLLQDILFFHGYTSPLWKQLLFILLSIASFGTVYLLSAWFLPLRVALTLTPCALYQADYVVVTVRLSCFSS